MDSFNMRSALSPQSNNSSETLQSVPPPYQEFAPQTTTTPSFNPPATRTLKVEYDPDSHPKNLRIFEHDSPEPLYSASLHGQTGRLTGAAGHMVFRTTTTSTSNVTTEFATATFHQSGKPRISLSFQGHPVTMGGYFGSTYSMLTFTSNATGKPLRWKRPGQAYDLVCIDEGEREIAEVKFGEVPGRCGEVRVMGEEVVGDERAVQELVVSGLSYVHLSKYFPNFTGGKGLGYLI